MVLSCDIAILGLRFESIWMNVLEIFKAIKTSWWKCGVHPKKTFRLVVSIGKRDGVSVQIGQGTFDLFEVEATLTQNGLVNLLDRGSQTCTSYNGYTWIYKQRHIYFHIFSILSVSFSEQDNSNSFYLQVFHKQIKVDVLMKHLAARHQQTFAASPCASITLLRDCMKGSFQSS